MPRINNLEFLKPPNTVLKTDNFTAEPGKSYAIDMSAALTGPVTLSTNQATVTIDQTGSGALTYPFTFYTYRYERISLNITSGPYGGSAYVTPSATLGELASALGVNVHPESDPAQSLQDYMGDGYIQIGPGFPTSPLQPQEPKESYPDLSIELQIQTSFAFWGADSIGIVTSVDGSYSDAQSSPYWPSWASVIDGGTGSSPESATINSPAIRIVLPAPGEGTAEGSTISFVDTTAFAGLPSTPYPAWNGYPPVFWGKIGGVNADGSSGVSGVTFDGCSRVDFVAKVSDGTPNWEPVTYSNAGTTCTPVV